jgi:hypothetical protein
MKNPILCGGFIGAVLVGLSMPFNVIAQDKPASSPAPAVSSPAKYSAIIEHTIKLVKGGVSAELIKTYVDSWSTPYNLDASDIIALKENNVPDDITSAVVKRGAALNLLAREYQVQTAQAAPALVAPALAISAPAPNYYTLDPEGYDYFQYYYLYPRTLSFANDRLYSHFGSSYSYPSYFNPAPAPFHPLPPGAFRRHQPAH